MTTRPHTTAAAAIYYIILFTQERINFNLKELEIIHVRAKKGVFFYPLATMVKIQVKYIMGYICYMRLL